MWRSQRRRTLCLRRWRGVVAGHNCRLRCFSPPDNRSIKLDTQPAAHRWVHTAGKTTREHMEHRDDAHLNARVWRYKHMSIHSDKTSSNMVPDGCVSSSVARCAHTGMVIMTPMQFFIVAAKKAEASVQERDLTTSAACCQSRRTKRNMADKVKVIPRVPRSCQ